MPRSVQIHDDDAAECPSPVRLAAEASLPRKPVTRAPEDNYPKAIIAVRSSIDELLIR